MRGLLLLKTSFMLAFFKGCKQYEEQVNKVFKLIKIIAFCRQLT